MKYITHAVRITLLFVLCGATAQAQVGRRTGQSERIVVPLELPEPPSGLRQIDVEQGAMVSCVCLERQEQEPCSEEEARSETAFRGSEVDVKARILRSHEPMYTREARLNETSGRVVLEVALGSAGKVSNIRVLEGLPDGLTNSAIQAACQMEFEPALKDGRAVAQLVKVEYNFDIDSRMFRQGTPMRPPLRVPTRRMPPPFGLPPQPLDFAPHEESPVYPVGLPSRFFPYTFLPSPQLPFGGFWPCPWPSPF